MKIEMWYLVAYDADGNRQTGCTNMGSYDGMLRSKARHEREQSEWMAKMVAEFGSVGTYRPYSFEVEAAT